MHMHRRHSHLETLESRRLMSIAGFPSAGMDVRLLGAGDFNSDGIDDYVKVNDVTGDIQLIEVTDLSGNATYSAPTTMGSTGSGSTLTALGVGFYKAGADLNPSQKDLIFWDSSLRMFGWWSTSNGVADGGWGWINGDTVLGSSAVDSSWAPWGTGDVNNDGYGDVIFRNTTTGDIGVWYLQDSQVVNADIIGPCEDSAWRCVGIEDFDADGKNEILWDNTTSGAMYTWVMDADTHHFSGQTTYYGYTSFDQFYNYEPNTPWVAFVLAGTDGDVAHNDILMENIDTGSIYSMRIHPDGSWGGIFLGLFYL